MAIGWITVLKSVPWTQVINNAPVIADGARKLWKTVGRKPVMPDTAEAAGIASSDPSALEARIAGLEQTVADLHAQMLASSELIKSLAEQNTELVARIETHRVRSAWLGLASVLALVLAIAGIALAMR